MLAPIIERFMDIMMNTSVETGEGIEAVGLFKY